MNDFILDYKSFPYEYVNQKASSFSHDYMPATKFYSKHLRAFKLGLLI